MVDPYCDHLAAPNPWVLTLSIVLVIGILVSYLPQHVKIIKNGTSAGLSPWWVLLGTVSSIAAIANIVTLPTSQHDMACCKEISAAACGAALLGIVQIGIQWTCFMAIMILFLAFFPRQSDEQQQWNQPGEGPLPPRRDAVIVGCTSLAAILFVGIGSLIFLARAPALLLGWANFLGVCSSVLACIQYLPQIWTTYKIQKILSLSIITMIIQVPGAFLFAFSLFLRVGWQGWSSWLVFIVTGVFQGCLLAMAISFWLRDRKPMDEDDSRFDQQPTESDPLLRPSFGGSARSSRRPISSNSQNPIGMLYSATPPDQSSVPSEFGTSPDRRRLSVRGG